MGRVLKDELKFDPRNQFRVAKADGLVCAGKPFRKGEELDKTLVTERRLSQLWKAGVLHMIEVADKKKASVKQTKQTSVKAKKAKAPKDIDQKKEMLTKEFEELTGEKPDANWSVEELQTKVLEAEF